MVDSPFWTNPSPASTFCQVVESRLYHAVGAAAPQQQRPISLGDCDSNRISRHLAGQSLTVLSGLRPSAEAVAAKVNFEVNLSDSPSAQEVLRVKTWKVGLVFWVCWRFGDGKRLAAQCPGANGTLGPGGRRKATRLLGGEAPEIAVMKFFSCGVQPSLILDPTLTMRCVGRTPIGDGSSGDLCTVDLAAQGVADLFSGALQEGVDL